MNLSITTHLFCFTSFAKHRLLKKNLSKPCFREAGLSCSKVIAKLTQNEDDSLPVIDERSLFPFRVLSLVGSSRYDRG